MRPHWPRSAKAAPCSVAFLAILLGFGGVAPAAGAGLPRPDSARAWVQLPWGTFVSPCSDAFATSLVSPVAPSERSRSYARSDALTTRIRDLHPGPMLAADRFEEFGADDKDRVSVSRAALLSLVLPGAGQWYVGARGRAAGFLAADGMIWAAFGFFEAVGAAKRNDSRVYARVHAGIDPAGKGDEFYRTITFYDSREEYNDLARVFDPRRPYYSDIPYWHWQWDSDAARSRYRGMRNQSNEAFNRGKFALGALAVNRLVAAFDAIRLAKSINRRARMETASWKIHFQGNPAAANPCFALTFSRQF